MRRWIFILVPLILVGGLVTWRINAKKADDARAAAEAKGRRGSAASVEIATAQALPIVESVEAVGTVVSEFSVGLSPRTAGRIVFLEVREGDRVEPGQLIARIDPSQAEAGVLGARANVNESRSRLAQAEATLQSNRVQIDQAIQQATAEVANAQAALTQTQRSVEGRIASAQAAAKSAGAALSAAKSTVNSRRAELESARASAKNAETYLSRVRSQYEKGYISAQELDNAATGAAAARAQVDVAQASLESARSGIETATAEQEAAQTALQTARASGAAEIQAAQARLSQAQAALKSAQANRAQIPANQANIEALRAGVSAAEAQLNAASSQKSDTELRSSIAGVVTARSADPGDMASPGQPVVRIDSVGSMLINASIPLEESNRVRRGMPVRVTIEGSDIAPFEAQVDQLVPAADPQDRQFLVRVRIPTGNTSIRPGMFARIAIEVSRVEAPVAVPNEAVQNGEITVVGADQKAIKRKVEVGKQGNQSVEILSGLKVGERVVVLSYTPVREGATVNPTAERLSDGTRRILTAPPADKGGGAKK